MSYPHLFPSGFLEFQDDCSGPILYRDQPSRESDGVRLNDWLNKYATGQYKGGDFLRLATNLRNTTRMWNRLPENVKTQFRNLINSSNLTENFGDINNAATSTNVDPKELVDTAVSNYGPVHYGPVHHDNSKMSIFVIIIVAIVAVVIGFLIACCSV